MDVQKIVSLCMKDVLEDGCYWSENWKQKR